MKTTKLLRYIPCLIFLVFISCRHKNNGNKDANAKNNLQSANKDSAKAKDTINANLAAKDNNSGIAIDGGVMIVSNTIVQNIESPKDFRTFLSALKKTGIDKILEQKGPYTVFLPNNDAFSKLGPIKWNELLTDKKQTQLEKILKFHIVAGEVKLHDLVAGSTLSTLSGDPLVVIVDNGKTKLMDGNGNLVEITQPDILSKNGIIHIVDGVLMPKAAPGNQ